MENLRDKNPASQNGMTPFHSATHNGHLEVCKLIIENVEDKNPQDHLGMTPLHIAASNGYSAICKLIIDIHVSFQSIT